MFKFWAAARTIFGTTEPQMFMNSVFLSCTLSGTEADESILIPNILSFLKLEVSNYFKIYDKEGRKFDNIDKKCMENAYVKFFDSIVKY